MSSERRLHPYSILFAFLAQIRAFVIPGLLVIFGARSRGGDWEPWMMLFIIPNAIWAVLRYVTYRFHYDPSELVIRSGLVFRKERHIPYTRIQNIDAVQNVLHRLLNVVEVRVETGAGGSPEAVMSVLPAAALSEMRQQVFAEARASTDAGAAEPAPALPPALLQLDTRELLLCGFIENRGAVLIAAGMGLIWELGLADRLLGSAFGGDGATGRGRLRNVFRSLRTAGQITPLRVALTILGFGVLVVALRVLSMIWAVIRLHGYRVTLTGDDLRSEYGLLTRVAATIPLRRIQSLTVREGLLHRVTERVAVRADTAGGTGEHERGRTERESLAPILRRPALGGFVRTVLGGVDLDAVEWRPIAPRAFRREVKGWLVIAGVLQAGAAVLLGWWALVVTPLLLAWAVVGARQTVRHLGWGVSDEAVFFRTGWLWRRVSMVRFAKIQAVALHESPFDRRTAMARVRVDTAGASETSRISIPYLERETAVALQVALARHAAAREFTW